MNIIKATQEHLDQLVSLFDGYRIFYEQSSDPEGARDFLTNRLKNNDSIIFIAYDEQSVAVGFTQLYPIFSSVSMKPLHVLNDLYVVKRFRGQGIGRSLMEYAKVHIRDINSKGLILQTAVDNPAQHLYEKLGWQRDSEYIHYTWENI